MFLSALINVIKYGEMWQTFIYTSKKIRKFLTQKKRVQSTIHTNFWKQKYVCILINCQVYTTKRKFFVSLDV